MALVVASKGQYIAREFQADIALTEYRLVIPATNLHALNAEIYALSECQNVLVNSVDDVPHCRFMLPAIIDRSPLMIAVASNGTSPVLTRQIRTQLESTIPHRAWAFSRIFWKMA